ncbi:MAG TPA: epimerase, partial [Mucilaginibacter sp.]
MKPVNILITGTTGMVGGGVLHECLNDPKIASITLLNRRSAGVVHPKVKEVLLDDLFAFTGNEPVLNNIDACFYCLGVTSIGKSEEEYTRLTYDLTLTIAKPLLRLNPEMTFCYVTAKGTDSSEKGKTMWARVKGKTE